ncbi:ABC1 family [Nakaseomyces glabratus]|nr:ABC1 family [Nakaseomyces glabratus]KAH7597852.1 ABC1 family [Nakaseomyces glabratus]KAH7598430.1 ABC1 family [Nakaseomyces glabratus]KAH7603859.1 ABC1 family [Nakaseomyces glabratus]KAH7612146.1 ABC1 family [Nakaseomyces glabratus]
MLLNLIKSRAKVTTALAKVRVVGRQRRFLISPLTTASIATGAISLSIYHNRREHLLNETLEPDPTGDTFEMGLYIASEKERETLAASGKLDVIRKSRSLLVRSILKLWVVLDDNIIEPVLTVCRFLELMGLFLPVFSLYPICWLGRRIKLNDDITDTRGSIIWCKLIRIALELAGPSFIKLGQWAGSRTDIFSETLCYELGKLHSKVRPHSIEYSKKMITSSFEVDDFDEIFDSFGEKPLGVGAIAQVHVGKLNDAFYNKYSNKTPENNKWCAIKIIHPRVRNQIYRDLKIMKFFACVIDGIPTMEWLSLPNEVEQFSILMKLQLDLRIEALNLKRFNENFKDATQVKFATPYLELSNRDVLFEEYLHGFPMEDFLKVKRHIKDDDLCRRVSDPFVEAFLQMLIRDDFVHADLHPGNVMIRFVKTNKYGTQIISSEESSYNISHTLREKWRNKDSDLIPYLKSALTTYTPQICYIDTGLVTELNDRNRVNFIALFNALAQFDGYRAGELMIERSRTPETAIDKDLFALKVEKLVDKVKQRTFTLGNVSIGDLLDQMLRMVRSHHVRMEGDFVSVVVAILLLEGIGRQLDPDLDLFERFVFYYSLHF